ncbi:UNVERIFIED_CONTAM: hypothetical protein FKN15_056725 [Acipenser sinensis]
MVNILDYSFSSDDDLFAVSPEPRSTQPVQPAFPGPTPRQLRSAVFTTPNFSAQMSASPGPSQDPLPFPCCPAQLAHAPVRHSSHLATRSSATPDIRDWMIPRLQHYLRSNNIPFKSTAHKENLFNLCLSTLQHPSCRRHYEDSTQCCQVSRQNKLNPCQYGCLYKFQPVTLKTSPILIIGRLDNTLPRTHCIFTSGKHRRREHYEHPAGPHSGPFSVKCFSSFCSSAVWIQRMFLQLGAADPAIHPGVSTPAIVVQQATVTFQKWTTEADFTHHAHTASLSAVAVNDRYLATGSKDETIQLYDLKKRVEHGSLLHHDGTISCLEFYGRTHLLSGGEDGLICVWNTKKWECLKSIRAHKGHVTSLSVHPSGKIALSVGTDKTLRTWNLIDGRSAFIKNIKQNAHIVMWSPAGERYVVVVNEKMDIYNLETASVTGTISNKKRISSIRFITNTIVVVAGDEETVRLYDTDSLKCLCEFKAHENRYSVLRYLGVSHVVSCNKLELRVY